MDASPEKRLPEADSLPDGFVEVTPEPSPLSPPSDGYKEAFLDDLLPSCDTSTAFPGPPPPETLAPAHLVDGTETLSVSADFLTRGDGVGDSSDSAPRDGILVSETSGDTSKELSGPQNEISVGTSLEENGQGDCQISGTETKGQLELQVNKQKDPSEAKRKVAKRNTKSEKELLEFTLNYQKVVAERDAAVAVREKLESLCREQQRQNKMLMDECQRVSTEGQNMRLDLSTKFNDAIKAMIKTDFLKSVTRPLLLVSIPC